MKMNDIPNGDPAKCVRQEDIEKEYKELLISRGIEHIKDNPNIAESWEGWKTRGGGLDLVKEAYVDSRDLWGV